MTEDDDVGFDLTAWEAPPPPAGIADAVISRVHQPTGAAAIETPPARRRTWLWISGGTLVAAAATFALVMTRSSSDEVLAGSGAVATTRPTHVDLGGTTAELDADTGLVWFREGHRIVANQPRGTATWRVAPEDTLVIDAGATVASVVASGASLRVEVEMNFTDARTIGASVLTAAAVALVTVVVYEGHTSVSGSEHAVTVSSGTTVAVAPGHSPTTRDELSAQKTRLAALEAELAMMRLQVAGLVPQPPTVPSPVPQPKQTVALGCTDFDKLLTRGDEQLNLSMYADALSTFKAALGCRPTDQKVIRRAFLAACNSKNASEARTFFARVTNNQSLVQICLRNGIDPRTAATNPDLTGSPFQPTKPATVSSPGCDAKKGDDDEAKGDQLMNQGSWAAALASFEKVYPCRPTVVSKLYLSACRAKSFMKAKTYFQKLPARSQQAMAQICLKDGFDPRK